VRELGANFCALRGTRRQRFFRRHNYAELKKRQFFSAGVPDKAGRWRGVTRRVVRHHACNGSLLRLDWLSTGIAPTWWLPRCGDGARGICGTLLKRATEETVLISSGGSDWLTPSGTAEKVDGGFRITARKIFSSGCPMGDLLITMAVYDDPQDGPTAVHFPISFKDEKVTIMDNWRTLGMRTWVARRVIDRSLCAEHHRRRPRASGIHFQRHRGSSPASFVRHVGVAEATTTWRSSRSAEAWIAFLIGEMTNA
jgi:acyl-CoA dehydrogenase